MAPYAPSNDVVKLTKYGFSQPLHNLFPRLSFGTATLPTVSSTDLPSSSKITIVNGLPHLGVGPVVLQSSLSPLNAETSDVTARHDTPVRLAYLGILVIPIVFILVLFFLMRRKRQKPAKKTTPASHALRSETARAVADSEMPRMQQLPRDRIRAMNSVARDTEVPLSSPVDHQIFSPRPPSPPTNDFPRSLGNYFSSLAAPGPVEPPSPLTSASTFATNLSSLPQTPCTPCFAESSNPSLLPDFESGNTEDETEESRFTWDFKCKGNVDRLSRVSIGQVLDISRANNAGVCLSKDPATKGDIQAPSSENKDDAAEETTESLDESSLSDAGSFVVISRPSESKRVSTMLDLALEVKDEGLLSLSKDTAELSSKDIECISLMTSTPELLDSSGLDVPAPNPASQPKNGKRFSTASALTTLDLNFDTLSFSVAVMDALSPMPDADDKGKPVTDNETPFTKPSEEVKQPILEDQYAIKKRPILSKPNHRILSPTSSKLKNPTQDIDGNLPSLTPNSSSPLACVSGNPFDQASAFLETESSNTKTLRRPGMGRIRASSENNLGAFAKFCSFEAGLSDEKCTPWHGSRTPEGALALVRNAGMTSVLNTTMRSKDVLLCSSLSMPLGVELACLASLSRRGRMEMD